MADIESRVVECFLNVFPSLSREQIEQATPETMATWDSVAHVTLLSAVAEEFHLDMDEEFLDQATSFGKIVDYVKAHTA